MGKSPIIQQLNGKLKQAEGKVQEVTGDKLGGRIRQAEGKAEEEIAELRIQHKKRTRDETEAESVAREEKARQKELNKDLDDDW